LIYIYFSDNRYQYNSLNRYTTLCLDLLATYLIIFILFKNMTDAIKRQHRLMEKLA